ncbi:hypothetical protein H9655_09475 [Cytobacillus sp. Sa5YUA1]|uniref:Uncharacterized protein n=1 Tax=Cytobacillus stercorigallinarum TaxID=2762240 RepID=A0ABR8QNZ4_9BACI|nr:hypothetical protein [Cytobacillus stercorigallinarum]MBD7937262.1 hypothetical protein [Cytobacillus stercorigallinarum]
MKQQLTLMEAYMIELLRNQGVTDEEIIKKSLSNDTTEWRKYNEQFEFEQLAHLAQKDEANFVSMINNGYRIKFLTFPGLQRILSMKFGLEKDQDYMLVENGVSNIKVSEGQLKEIEKVLSLNWKIKREETSISIQNG